MSGWLKAVSLPLAVAILSICSISCSSISVAKIRLINAIPDSQPVDVYINGALIASNLAFGAIQPNASPAGYITVTPGTENMESFVRGSTIDPISPTATFPLNGSTSYTIIGVGLELNDATPLVLTDDTTVPTSGNVEFRIVNVSLNSPIGGVDVYFVPPGTDITSFTPQINALGDGQASPYQSLPFLAGGYSVIVTKTGGKTALISQSSSSPSGSITTIVIVDNAGGNNGMSQTPLVLNDVNKRGIA
jgi:hypothetical protein